MDYNRYRLKASAAREALKLYSRKIEKEHLYKQMKKASGDLLLFWARLDPVKGSEQAEIPQARDVIKESEGLFKGGSSLTKALLSERNKDKKLGNFNFFIIKI